MSETHAQATTDKKPDLAMPLHTLLGFWRGEMDRFAREVDAATEHTVREARRGMDEMHRLMSAQLDVTRQATAIYTDALRRLTEVGPRT